MKRTHEIEQDESTSKKIKVENPILHPPKLLFGTYKLSKTSCPAAIRAAFHPTPSATLSSSSSSSTSTYLGIDCAPIYNNEQSVGKALTSALNAANISRSNIWIQSKLWRSVTPSKVHTAIRKSIKDLQATYLDCILMHWPGPGRRLHAPPVTRTKIINTVVVKSINKNPDKVVCVPEHWMSATRLECYKEMCSAIPLGLTRSVGVCNFSLRQLKELITYCNMHALPLPCVVQNEFHPYHHVYAAPLIQYCQANNITYQAHSSLGGPMPKNNDDWSSLVGHEVVMKIAQVQKVSAGVLLFRWALSKGVTSIIAKSTKSKRIQENRGVCDEVFDKEKGGDEMDGLDLGHQGNTCFTWLRESDPDVY